MLSSSSEKLYEFVVNLIDESKGKGRELSFQEKYLGRIQELSSHQLYLEIVQEYLTSNIYPVTKDNWRLSLLKEVANRRNERIFADACIDALVQICEIKFENESFGNKKLLVRRITWMDKYELQLYLERIKGEKVQEVEITKSEILAQVKNELIKDDIFSVKVIGESMLMAGIMPGATLIVAKNIPVNHQDVVVVRIDGQLYVKRYINQNGKVHFRSENKGYFEIRGFEIEILGVVKMVIHKY